MTPRTCLTPAHPNPPLIPRSTDQNLRLSRLYPYCIDKCRIFLAIASHLYGHLAANLVPFRRKFPANSC